MGEQNTVLTLHLETDIDARVMANIDQAMKGEKTILLRRDLLLQS